MAEQIMWAVKRAGREVEGTRAASRLAAKQAFYERCRTYAGQWRLAERHGYSVERITEAPNA